jgi:hypothetical protein
VCKDFQKELPMPKLLPQPTDQYRSRKLYLHNYGNYVYNNKTMHCFVWDELTAAKTSDDVASAWYYRLLKYKDEYEHVSPCHVPNKQ